MFYLEYHYHFPQKKLSHTLNFYASHKITVIPYSGKRMTKRTNHSTILGFVWLAVQLCRAEQWVADICFELSGTVALPFISVRTNTFTACEFRCIFVSPQSTKNWSNSKQCAAYPCNGYRQLNKLRVASHVLKIQRTFHLYTAIDGRHQHRRKNWIFLRCAIIGFVFSTLLILFAFTFSLWCLRTVPGLLDK